MTAGNPIGEHLVGDRVALWLAARADSLRLDAEHLEQRSDTITSMRVLERNSQRAGVYRALADELDSVARDARRGLFSGPVYMYPDGMGVLRELTGAFATAAPTLLLVESELGRVTGVQFANRRQAADLARDLAVALAPDPAGGPPAVDPPVDEPQDIATVQTPAGTRPLRVINGGGR